VLHPALRAPRDAVIEDGGKNVVPEVWAVLDKIKAFTGEELSSSSLVAAPHASCLVAAAVVICCCCCPGPATAAAAIACPCVVAAAGCRPSDCCCASFLTAAIHPNIHTSRPLPVQSACAVGSGRA